MSSNVHEPPTDVKRKLLRLPLVLFPEQTPCHLRKAFSRLMLRPMEQWGWNEDVRLYFIRTTWPASLVLHGRGLSGRSLSLHGMSPVRVVIRGYITKIIEHFQFSWYDKRQAAFEASGRGTAANSTAPQTKMPNPFVQDRTNGFYSIIPPFRKSGFLSPLRGRATHAG